MPNDGEMMMTIVEVQIDEDLLRHPAIPESDPWSTVYFIRGGKIVANGRIGMRYGYEITVYLDPADEKSREYFKDDPVVQILGRHAGWKFQRFDGGSLSMYADDTPERGEDLDRQQVGVRLWLCVEETLRPH